MKIILLLFLDCLVSATNSFGVPYNKKYQERFTGNPTRPILPANYGIKNNGTLISKTDLDAWLSACLKFHSPVYFPAGKYLLPPDFEFDFGSTDISIFGDGQNKTILTTYSNASTNFAIPEKINLTKQKPGKDGIYQVDIIASSLHRDFLSKTGFELDSYVQIEKGMVSPISLTSVKALGYVTELDAAGPDPGIDGLYVVARHAYHDYGGGFKQITLGYNGSPMYLQGTVLQRTNGKWKRFYSSVAFICEGNFSVSNISFSNFRPYLFLPAAKKAFTKRKMSDRFLIEHCRFEQTARILATISYGGISESPNWYKASTYYPANQDLSFKNFTIKNSDFSYIHESIVWGAPPSIMYNINNNSIHDCYTILNCFYLFAQNNRHLPIRENIKYSITKNSFLRIRALNPGSENTVHLIRTMNKGVIANNIFTDCTGIHIYLGAAAIVKNNIIKTFMATVPTTQPRPPLILVKIAKNELLTFTGNDFSMAMMGNLVANESDASFNFSNNKLIGAAVRYITSLTTGHLKLDKYRTYTILDTTVFYQLTGMGNYDPALRLSNTVYYNKRKSRWEALSVMPLMYLYSEADHFNKTKKNVRFIRNEIEATCLTRIQKKLFTRLNEVFFENNQIQYCSGLLAGNDSAVIELYKFTGNTIKNGSLQMTSLGNVSTAVRSLIISGNTFYVDFTGASAFTASKTLIFRDNLFIRNEDFNFIDNNSFALFGLSTLPVPSYCLSLKGYPGQQMTVSGNRFIADMTRGGIILITNPDKVIIKNNYFNLHVPAWQVSNIKTRQAIYFNSAVPASFINIYRNIFLPQTDKENYLVSFDNGSSTILNFLNAENKVSGNEDDVVKTILATNKHFTNYLNRKNNFTDKESILSVTTRINNSK